MYVWGGALPTADIESCSNNYCILQTVLRDARLDAFYHDPSFFEAAMSFILNLFFIFYKYVLYGMKNPNLIKNIN